MSSHVKEVRACVQPEAGRCLPCSRKVEEASGEAREVDSAGLTEPCRDFRLYPSESHRRAPEGRKDMIWL